MGIAILQRYLALSIMSVCSSACIHGLSYRFFFGVCAPSRFILPSHRDTSVLVVWQRFGQALLFKQCEWHTHLVCKTHPWHVLTHGGHEDSWNKVIFFLGWAEIQGWLGGHHFRYLPTSDCISQTAAGSQECWAFSADWTTLKPQPRCPISNRSFSI